MMERSLTVLYLPQVFHSGIPVTLIPLDATNTSPINEFFFEEFEKSQDTYEAQYCFKSLKMYRDKMSDDQFYSVISFHHSLTQLCLLHIEEEWECIDGYICG